ncbi:MAG: orotate phosphoribosyltransferase, partial [Betaproteobacteria bacterium]|nr:orotate phosphoribosyltransferase [Betaproteobacteria bacterium]
MTTPAAETGNTLAVAHALLEAGCVSFCTREPYRLPSGWASPVY